MISVPSVRFLTARCTTIVEWFYVIVVSAYLYSTTRIQGLADAMQWIGKIFIEDETEGNIIQQILPLYVK